jgi:hypothetical protein
MMSRYFFLPFSNLTLNFNWREIIPKKMPLLPGKKNIGHNIKEMEANGHSYKSSLAAALKKAGVKKSTHHVEVKASSSSNHHPFLGPRKKK